MSDLGSEFTCLSNILDRSLGARTGVLKTVTEKAILAPVALAVALLILANAGGFQLFSLLFMTSLTGNVLSNQLMMVESALMIGGGLLALIIGPRVGIKMLLLLGE